MKQQIKALESEVERLKAERDAARWDAAHYHDLLLLRCGITAAELAPRSAVLALEARHPDG